MDGLFAPKKKEKKNIIKLENIYILFTASAPMPQGSEIAKDWVFINYTFKRFEVRNLE